MFWSKDQNRQSGKGVSICQDVMEQGLAARAESPAAEAAEKAKKVPEEVAAKARAKDSDRAEAREIPVAAATLSHCFQTTSD